MNRISLPYPEITNPKRHLDSSEAESRRLFPYYAGFSAAFVESTLATIELSKEAVILDPWNGSGTTTSTAFQKGFTAIGSDLNPAMILVAKAGFVSKLDIDSLVPLSHSIVDNMSFLSEPLDNDPLSNWFSDKSARLLREIETRINQTLVSHSTYLSLDNAESLEKLTPLASFFYLALFRVTRRLTQEFVASNPTWIKVPKDDSSKKQLTGTQAISLFLKEVETLRDQHHFINSSDFDTKRINLKLSNAENLPLEKASVDAVITSPPYCTRIDYAVATYVELAVLRIGGERFSQLRRSLTGSSTVGKTSGEIMHEWGDECSTFLNALMNHPSKASGTYYLKNHVQYFDSLYKSLSETSRVLKPSAPCVLVVQNSYYKEIRNDIAKIICQMSENLSLKPTHRADFNATRSMVDLNKNSKKYIGKRSTIESVLFFEKAL
ncbi:DNA methylase [Pseudomonas aeruginosa]|uniref:DNA methylase n=1 Tax=Pseudomonas aeruginosa TaxID=287 RepID=UPI001CF6CC28|nr:DNA methylase [Pseudomonas aeruginosa]